MNELPDYSFFIFDRIWLKAYPEPFVNLRIQDNYLVYRMWKNNGYFEKWTENAFRLYRSLDCVKRLLKLGVKPEDITKDKCVDVRRYGVSDYYDISFVRVANKFQIGKYYFNVDVVKNVKFLSYAVVHGDKVRYEKVIYVPYSDFLRVLIKPYLEGFVPHMIRVFYNPLIEAKRLLKIDNSGYEFIHENFVNPEHYNDIVEVNHRLVNDISRLKEFVRNEWIKWFGDDIPIVVKVTQVEYSVDVFIDKLRLVNALRFVGAKSKTVKVDYDTKNIATWTDLGVKYYLTVKKGFQLKVYTKALRKSDGKMLNRVEFTMRVNKCVENFDVSDVINNDFIDVYNILKLALMNREAVNEIKEFLKPFAIKDSEEHYAFLLDLFVNGQVKGSGYYRDIAKMYKKKGLIKIVGRGRNSKYVLNEAYALMRECFIEKFGLIFKDVILSKLGYLA